MIAQPKSRTTKTLVLSTGKALASVSSLVLAMVLTRMFTETEWATYRQALLILSTLAPISGMGLAQSLMYFLPSHDPKHDRGIVLNSLMPLFVSGLICMLFIALGGNVLVARLFGNAELSRLLLVLSPVAVFQLINICVGPSMVATERVTTAAAFNIGSQLFITASIIACVFIQTSVEAVVWMRMLAIGSTSVVAMLILAGTFKNGRADWKGIKSHLGYGIPLGLTLMVGTFSRKIDRFMVGTFCDEKTYAIFDNGALELPLIAVITGSMTSVLLVDYRKMLSNDQKEDILPLLHRAIIKSGTILIPTMFFLLCMAPEFMVSLFSEKYRESAPVFRVFLLLLPARTLAFGSIALAAGRTKALAVVPVCSFAANAVLNYFAIQIFGYIGCAVVTVFVLYSVSALGRALIARDVLGCALVDFLPLRGMGKLMVLSAIPVPVIAGLNLAIGQYSDLGRLVATALVYGLILTALFLKFSVLTNQDLRAVLKMLPFNNSRSS